MGLREYERKRDFKLTPEPSGKGRLEARAGTRLSFVVQKHAASRLHYDFRLEHDGVLVSWAVPKGPSLDPADKRLAVKVEDHPLDYGGFEGTIPKGQYGGGSVIVWDRGHWYPAGDPAEGLRRGKLDFRLEGKKLAGSWALVRLRDRTGSEDNWLLIKHKDEFARAGTSITEERPESVKSGRMIEEIGARQKVSNSNRVPSEKPALRKPAVKKATAAKRAPRTATARKKPARRATAGAIGSRRSRSAPLQARTRGKARGKNPSPRALAAKLAGVRRAKLPHFVEPQLATLDSAAPTGTGWIHELKFDGYRMEARLENGRVTWISRNGLDWTKRFTALSAAIAALPAKAALLDGEIVVLREDGISHFQDLQNALSAGDGSDLTYFAFDLIHLEDLDLRRCALSERKAVLRALFAGVSRKASIRYSEHIVGGGPEFFAEACRSKLEGIVSKRIDGGYVSGRTRDWAKVKCSLRQEFVVVGFTQPSGSRVGFGSLVLGVHEGKRFRHAGRVGTGFDRALLLKLRKQLEAWKTDRPPFDEPLSADARRGVTWVKPRMVVEVSFTGWTAEGLLRHPTFEGVREDKRPAEVVKEVPRALRRPRSSRTVVKKAGARKKAARRARASASEDGDAVVAGITITHPERILDVESGLTKLAVARYYERIAPLLLPHISGRPLSVVRCPQGFASACFFQKHSAGMFPDTVKSLPVKDSSGVSRYLMVDSVAGLVGLVQMGVVELHPWGSRGDSLERPDRMFFDLDPAPDVTWRRVVDAALSMRAVLHGLGMLSFVKTTGGKGLHVVVPLARRYDWGHVKAFSHAIAEQLERSEPKEYIATASKAARKCRIFVDYLRNSRGATAVAPYSVRARKGASVSTPISWKELETLSRPDAFHIADVLARAKSKRGDPWAKFLSSPQTLPATGKTG